MNLKFHIKGKIWDYWKISKCSSENTVGWLEEGSDGGTFLLTSCANQCLNHKSGTFQPVHRISLPAKMSRRSFKAAVDWISLHLHLLTFLTWKHQITQSHIYRLQWRHTLHTCRYLERSHTEWQYTSWGINSCMNRFFIWTHLQSDWQPPVNHPQRDVLQ